AHAFLVVPHRAQPLAARTLEERQVLRVVDHAAGIGIFPVDADGVAEHQLRPGMRGMGNEGSARLMVAQNSDGLPFPIPDSPFPPLGFSPRCRYAFGVAIRPRAVRTRKPCWIR